MLQDGTIKPLDQGAKDKALHVICDMAKRSLRCLAAAQKTDLGKQALAACRLHSCSDTWTSIMAGLTVTHACHNIPVKSEHHGRLHNLGCRRLCSAQA